MILDFWFKIALIALSISTSMVAVALLVSFIASAVSTLKKGRHGR